ncbi:Macrolide export ATP-binding/permease protein MacB [Luteitalea pratensis]|uniref:Macrolide export ATP-binding/permease protein MacB n=1 Tax=Luteitalea pratensis TaxID=1855912 RepID=A0A143PGI3_LUTPR|nr:ABC transporter permease [Luteitalea pratensis]AMY07168.1 Macrolide export ATP-binding/permease protein MacB [Luteitalea pratensis]
MLKNYLTLAWKVLQRRKVFTAISLFGTSFTLVVLTVAVAMFDHTLSPMAPEINLDRTLVMSRARMRGDGNTWQSSPGYRLIHDYARKLPGVELMTVQTSGTLATSFVSGRKIESTLKHTDAEFWRVYQFAFLEGSPYGAADLETARLVLVINETSRKRFFDGQSALGRHIDADGQRFQVIGVVKDVPSMRTPSADLYAPLTTQKSKGWEEEYLGDFTPAFLLAANARPEDVRAELHSRLATWKSPQPQWKTLSATLETPFESMGRNLYPGDTDFTRTYGGFLSMILAGAALMFMALPAINLVNLNVSRIMERASEIGVRKAFGASSRTLVVQFVVENLALTVIGGLLGFLLAGFVLRSINQSGLIPYAELTLNMRIFLWGIALAVVFGLLSGVYPAWRMSRVHPVVALKGTR